MMDNLNNIKISQGDCLHIPLFINIGTDDAPIRLDFNKFSDLGIEVYLGVYPPSGCFERAIIRKKFTYLDANEFGDVVITISPEDTIKLCPGKYYYQIKARMQDDIQGEWVSTILERRDFYII